METGTRMMKIAELERLSGVPRHTIHRYIRDGLLHQPARTGKTMAYYDDSHLERLKTINEIKGTSRLPASYLKRLLADREVKDAGCETQEDGKGKGAIKERRKQQIKDSAFKVFLEKGYQQTRIQDITSAAGISTGTFYIYYEDKKELFMDVIDEMIRNTLMAIEEAVKEDSNAISRAVATTRFYMENYIYFSGIVNQLRGMMAEEEPQARDKFYALHNQLADPIIREIRSAIRNGVIRDVDPELLARSIMGIVEFLSIRLAIDDKYTTSQAISFMVDLVMNGISKD